MWPAGVLSVLLSETVTGRGLDLDALERNHVPKCDVHPDTDFVGEMCVIFGHGPRVSSVSNVHFISICSNKSDPDWQKHMCVFFKAEYL